MKTTHESDFTCNCCGKTFTSEKLLKSHKNKAKKCRGRYSSSSSASVKGKQIRFEFQGNAHDPAAESESGAHFRESDPIPFIFLPDLLAITR